MQRDDRKREASRESFKLVDRTSIETNNDNGNGGSVEYLKSEGSEEV